MLALFMKIVRMGIGEWGRLTYPLADGVIIGEFGEGLREVIAGSRLLDLVRFDFYDLPAEFSLLIDF